MIDKKLVNNFALLVSLSLLLSACESPSVSKSGGWSQTQDAAPRERVDVSTIADAQPRPVTRTRAGNKSPYTVLGKTYRLLPDSRGYKERGYASWYGTKFHGRNTANGEVYDMWGMTAAHKTLPIPSYVRVTNVQNGRSIVVRVNDRGPFHSQRIIDLSYAGAIKLGFEKQGVAQVDVVDVTPVVGAPAVSATSSVKPIARQSSPKTAISTPAKPAILVKPVSSEAPLNKPKATRPNTAVSSEQVASVNPVFLQVGAFQQPGPAKTLQVKVQQLLGMPVEVVEGSDRWHRVRVGPIIDTQSISSMRQRLAESGVRDTHIIYPR